MLIRSHHKSGRDRKKIIYLYSMPLSTRKKLCSILDENDMWTMLGIEQMKYDLSVLQDIKRNVKENQSPADRLITLYGDHGNHTVTDLFFLLKNMKQYRAMEVIKPLVDDSYHAHIGIEERQVLPNSQPDSNLGEPTSLRQYSSQKLLNVQSIEANESVVNSHQFAIMPNHYNHALRNVNECAAAILRIDFEDLVAATDGWNERLQLGRGGFGTVYKGKWKMTDVAVKKLICPSKSKDSDIQWEQSMTELKYLNSARHDNILPLYGYSINGSEPCLVYQLMLGGSLEERLANKTIYSALTWPQRFIVARGTARGLQFLHTYNNKPLIHGDIKPANILLDLHCEPKIGDFGLAREGLSNTSFVVTKIYGTEPYLPNELKKEKLLSTKVDTYSYGVVLCELVTGWRAYDKTRVVNNEKCPSLPAYISKRREVSELITEYMDKSCTTDPKWNFLACMLLYLGLNCSSDSADRRPNMESVLRELEKYQYEIA